MTTESCTASSTFELAQRVDALEVAYTDDDREAPVVQARGSVPSGGWSEPKLICADLSREAADSGVLELRLVAKAPPPGTFYIATPGHSVTALLVEDLPTWVREVRVVSRSNSAAYCIEQVRPLPPTAKRAA